MQAARLPPHTLAGIAGMSLVAALYIAHGVLAGLGGRGLPPVSLLALALPGALAAHICRLRGVQDDSEQEGAPSGLVTAHFAAALQVCVLFLAVLTIDWGRYARQAGPEVAAGVRDAALPAAVILAAVTVAVTYAGCILAAWLGSLAYLATFSLLRRRREGR